jgi:hypothetical protein
MLTGCDDGTHESTQSPNQGSITATQDLHAEWSSSFDDVQSAEADKHQTVVPSRDEDAHTVSGMYTCASSYGANRLKECRSLR